MPTAQRQPRRRSAALGVATGLLVAALIASPAAAATGPSTTTAPYLVPTAVGVEFTSLLTAGNTVPQTGGGTYRMVGVPDGLGAFDNGNGTFTVLMNHEIAMTAGAVRDHGSKGAFVSRWVIDKDTLQVLEGDDLIKSQRLWDTATSTYVTGTSAMDRFCSGDLPAVSAFYNAASGLGTMERLYMNGEERRPSFTPPAYGRAWAHIATGPNAGVSYELPRLGDTSFENVVASPYAQDKTIVVGLDDSDRKFTSEAATEPSELYLYIGTKTNTGTEIDKAGLSNGTLTGLKVSGAVNESSVTSGARFSLYDFGNVSSDTTGATLQSNSTANGVTQFRRIEDGQWDPHSPNDFYFVTTDQSGASGFSRLWRLHFDSITNPTAGGVIQLLIDGNGVGTNSGFGTGEMFDNMTVDHFGRVLLQEDIGNNALLGKVWAYDIASRTVVELGRHDSTRFITGGSGFLTQDEESSGVIDVSDILGEGYYLVDSQVHLASADAELVEGGQLLLMKAKVVAGLGFHSVGNNQALVVLGGSGNDHITVSQSGNTFTVGWDGTPPVTVTAASTVSHVVVNGAWGWDVIDVSDVNTTAQLFGGAGKDSLLGGLLNDALIGSTGRDVLDGGPGADSLVGGRGQDTFWTHPGDGDIIVDLSASDTSKTN